ncbi:Putative ribonuclease H protein [Arachis hypogaea]|nr:Putative ribonuclease H protein [Arachis hypogaea]
MSGLSINFEKLNLISVNCEQRWIDQACGILGCQQAALPVRYLGISLGANPRLVKTWKPIIDKVEQKLSLWKAKVLNKSGKLVLIKSVLNSLPIYYLSLYKMPKAVADKLITLQRNFMWCKENGNSGIPMVKWELVQAPKKVGGLGVGDAMLRNTALLFKWWWRFSKEDCPLWKKIVCSCNKLNPNVMLATQPLQVKGGPWRDICQLNIKEPRIRDKMVSGLAMEIGNGMQTRFWEDNWIQGGVLKGSYPRLYSISSQQGLLIGDCGFWDGLDWIWNFQWRRELFQWELELVNQLHERLRPVRLSSGREDSVVWKFDNKGVFSTRSVIQAIQAETLSAEITSYSFTSSVWKGFVPPRIELFGWFVLVDRVNTKERLGKIGVNILGDSLCVMCTKELESAEHLFLRCEVAWQVWCKWLRSLGRAWVIPGTIREMFESWHGLHNRQQGQQMWMTVFFAVIWNIWLERNARIFKNTRASLEVIHTKTVMSYTEWRGGDSGGGC